MSNLVNTVHKESELYLQMAGLVTVVFTAELASSKNSIAAFQKAFQRLRGPRDSLGPPSSREERRWPEWDDRYQKLRRRKDVSQQQSLSILNDGKANALSMDKSACYTLHKATLVSCTSRK
eukprot:TRINITY_DN26883_c0_g1_i1.p2 TRINITY_DN26883_c0_g1~~TRINITY_DN26883_c0_g1_i1.p2  ORF type:complete len:121 (-),score=13.99 TRINITY_DN26883_c0_g1_i1:144-506(-)